MKPAILNNFLKFKVAGITQLKPIDFQHGRHWISWTSIPVFILWARVFKASIIVVDIERNGKPSL